MCTHILVGVVRAFTVVWLFNGVQSLDCEYDKCIYIVICKLRICVYKGVM